jgi:tRNA A37 threonylcarbamoyladenosine modification protein TsaB
MYKILINTSDRKIKSVKIYQVVNGIDTILAEESGDIDIVSTLAKLLLQHKIDMNLVDSVEAFPGPGSFTGLKMGVTVANLLNWLMGKKQLGDLKMPEYGSEPHIQPHTEN